MGNMGIDCIAYHRFNPPHTKKKNIRKTCSALSDFTIHQSKYYQTNSNIFAAPLPQKNQGGTNKLKVPVALPLAGWILIIGI